jgi:hypothetical protein
VATNPAVEQIELNHPKLHQALTTFIRVVGLDGAFEENTHLEQKIARMNIHFNEEEGCYTNHEAIWLGLKFPFFTGTIDEKYTTAKTVAGHEMAHVRFTCKKTWDQYVYRAMRDYKNLAGLAKDVLNIVEDRRIERLMGLVSEFLQANFFLLGFRVSKDIEEMVNAQINQPFPLDAGMKLGMIRSGLLYISFMRMLPVFQNDEVMDYLKKCYKYVLYARSSNHTKGAVKASVKIMEILKPLIKEYNKESDEKFEQIFKNKDVGTYHAQSEDDVTQTSEKGEAVAYPNELEEEMEKLINEAKEELDKDEDEDDDGGGSSGIENEEENAEANEKNNSMNDKIFGEESESESETVRDFVDDITGNMDQIIELKKQIEKEAKKHENNAKEPVTREILHELLNSTKKEKMQQKKEQKEIEKIKELNPKIDSELHRGHKANFKDRTKMFQFSMNEYEGLKQEMMPYIKKTAREIEDLAQQTIARTLRQRKHGRLDRRKITKLAAFNDSRVFTKRKVDEEQLKMEVMLLVDVSGSNGAQMLNSKNDKYVSRYVWNQVVAILIHEILKEVEFEHTVWTFHEYSNTEISTPIDRSNCFEKDAGMYLKEIGAWGSNRDGFAIRYAGEYLNKFSESEKRLLIVLSDGQPSASGYGGKPAMEDVKQAVKDVENDGAKVIGIFTGSESENKFFKSMYENHLFVNNESIVELPKKLKDLLIQEFREYLEQL